MPVASKTPSNAWFVRITEPWERCEAIVESIKGWIDYSGCMVGFHVGAKTEKPHIHLALLLKSSIQKQSFDKRLVSQFALTPRTGYSSKQWDGNDGALSYLYHDESGKVENYLGLSEERIAHLKSCNAIIQTEVSKAKEKASFKVVDYVLNLIDEEREKYGDKTISWTSSMICDAIVMAVYDRKFYYPGDFSLGKYINEIMIKQCTDRMEVHQLASSILRRLRLDERT